MPSLCYEGTQEADPTEQHVSCALQEVPRANTRFRDRRKHSDAVCDSLYTHQHCLCKHALVTVPLSNSFPPSPQSSTLEPACPSSRHSRWRTACGAPAGRSRGGHSMNLDMPMK